jgi:hypothetical protein
MSTEPKAESQNRRERIPEFPSRFPGIAALRKAEFLDNETRDPERAAERRDEMLAAEIPL